MTREQRQFLHADRREHTDLDQLILEPGHSLLQNPVRVFREEGDDVLELS